MATRKLRIVNCDPVFTGNGANGEYTIYEVDAVDAGTGQVVNVPLRSFEHLEMDEIGDFVVEKYERPGKPTTYTLKKPREGGGKGGGGSSLGPKVDKLRERVQMLEDNVKYLQTNVADLMRKQPPVAAGGSVNSLSGGGGGTPAVEPDDDIPF